MSSLIPAFDLRHIPFSRRGSWINLSPVVAAHRTVDDVHLVSHRTGMHAVIGFSPRSASTPDDAHPAQERWDVAADAASVRWSLGPTSIQAVFAAPDTLRVRGDAAAALRLTEAAVELTPFTGTYLFRDPRDGSAVFTSYETGCRYRVTALEGELRVEGAESLGEATRAVTVSASDGGDHWEIAIEEFESSRPPFSASVPFAACVAEVSTEFAAFATRTAPWADDHDVPSSTRDASLRAAYVLWSATVSPAGFLRREAVLMSKHWMDKVWSWDHCFNAIALAPAEPRLALDQFLAPFDHQDETGALPDSIAHSERLYNFVKPPIHGWALDRLRAEGVTLTAGERDDVYDKLARWTRFWLEERRVRGRALAHYQHGNDSGWDNATVFDRTRLIESPDLAAFLLLQLDALARLAEECGHDATPWREEQNHVAGGLAELWRGDGYVARGVADGEDVDRTSLLPLLAIAAGEHLPPAARDALSEGVAAFLTQWGPATERPDSTRYESDGYWRGPIWAPSTMLLEDGLRRAGHPGVADDIAARFRRLCERGGFAENFDALTGEGLRDRAYTWTAAVYLVLVRDAVRRGDLPR
ncbi:amylo-alpha-1,6-glucosidase [Microbacterium sp. NPDC007973]|uniref:amylo-alpha-1,6-glucosidase n=1 Tax=Microbacterium sp. NPDC007973 TaxID=3364182 RepID=UPI0036E65A9D